MFRWYVKSITIHCFNTLKIMSELHTFSGAENKASTHKYQRVKFLDLWHFWCIRKLYRNIGRNTYIYINHVCERPPSERCAVKSNLKNLLGLCNQPQWFSCNRKTKNHKRGSPPLFDNESGRNKILWHFTNQNGHSSVGWGSFSTTNIYSLNLLSCRIKSSSWSTGNKGPLHSITALFE